MARTPALFVGHGSPMNSIEDSGYTQGWAALGQAFGTSKPKAVLAVSAHWYIHGTAVTAMPMPRTIHDFGQGFPQELFDFRYPAEGDPGLAARVQAILAPLDVALDQTWGLDHGTWSVLAHMFPGADVPVAQLSIDRAQPHAFHLELGQRLSPLRDEGVLILGLGNVVHNLRTIKWQGGEPYDWATSFNDHVRAAIARGDRAALIDYANFGDAARLSVPTPEHYLPLLYTLGAQSPGESVTFPVDGIDLGSISMLSVKVG